MIQVDRFPKFDRAKGPANPRKMILSAAEFWTANLLIFALSLYMALYTGCIFATYVRPPSM